MKKRILALLLALAMTASLAACGGSQDSSSNTKTEKVSYGTAEEAYEQAKACYDALSALSGEELLEEFIAKQAELNYDGNTEEFYVTPESSLVDGFSDAVLALDEYETGLSGETSYGYFVVMRLPISEEDLAEIHEIYVNDLFSARLNEKAEAAQVVEADVLAQVDFTAYFEKLTELQALLDAKYEELTAADEDEGDASAALSDEELEEALLAAVPQEAREDCASYLTDGLLTNDTVVLTVDGEEVTASTYLYFLGYNATTFISTLAVYGMEVSLDDEFSEGETYLETFVELARDYCVQYATAQNLAKENGVVLTEEHLEEIQTTMEEAAESSLLYVGCNLSMLEKMMTYGLYGDTYMDYLYGENGIETPTDEDVREYASENGYYNCRYILFRVEETADSADEDEGADAGEESSAQ